MTRFALALAAILLVIFSSGSTHVRLRQGAATPAVVVQAREQGRMIAGDASMRMEVPAAPQAAPLLASAANAEGPAPALLVYLGLVLVGSLVAVALVWRGQRV